nr:MFS transporter [Saccharopolyspora shandongensis]
MTIETATRTGIHRAWWVAAVTALVVIGAGACATTAGLLITPLHHEFGWSRAAIGVAVSVNMALYGLTAPFSAALMDRFGIRRVAVAALLLIAAGAGLTTVVSDSWHLVVGWGLFVGVGCGALAMAFAATVTHRWFVARCGLVTGLLTAASVFGQFAFLPVMSWVIDHFTWRSATVGLALIALVTAPLAWSVLRDHPADLGLRPYGATVSRRSRSRCRVRPGARCDCCSTRRGPARSGCWRALSRSAGRPPTGSCGPTSPLPRTITACRPRWRPHCSRSSAW